MGTTADKLEYLNDTKTAIKNAIVAKGVAVPDGTTFRAYSDLIINRLVSYSEELRPTNSAGEVLLLGTGQPNGGEWSESNPISNTIGIAVASLDNCLLTIYPSKGIGQCRTSSGTIVTTNISTVIRYDAEQNANAYWLLSENTVLPQNVSIFYVWGDVG